MTQGNWEGAFTNGITKGAPVRVEIIGETRGYRANLYLDKSGAPVARWMAGTPKRKKLVFSAETNLPAELGGRCEVEMTLANGEIKGKFTGKDSPGSFRLTRIEKKPPSLGAKPPAGAIVLFDGSNLDAWQPAERPWKITPDGAVEVGKGALHTKDEFGDGEYHIEFRTPYMRNKKGQARGNSGVYVLGRYEIQVLDSFGLKTRDNECGGVYKIATPKVNASLPPLEWQTYDIIMRAPKFNEQGDKIQNAVITMRHNGIVIHDNVELPGMTGGSVSDTEAPKGILFLQDHGNKVQYRNIWFKPR
ncbi:MAG TPA: DUF1080 domain-containing protein [Candidatus Bathyarchaeia archaeon]|nr:DUF1080 domain-containing protein [Candidatus Bathyarchaeia archaeon]